MKKQIFKHLVVRSQYFFLLLAILIVANCKTTSSENPPEDPPQIQSAFQITDIIIDQKQKTGVIYQVLGTYNNVTAGHASLSGRIYFGDGQDASMVGFIPAQLFPTSASTWTGYVLYHYYTTSKTYKVKAEVTAYFSTGQITSSFEKNINI